MIMGMEEIDYAWFLITPVLRLLCDSSRGKSVVGIYSPNMPGILDIQIPTQDFTLLMPLIVEQKFKDNCIKIVMRRKEDVERIFGTYINTPLNEQGVAFINSELLRLELIRVANGEKPIYKIAEEIFGLENAS